MVSSERIYSNIFSKFNIDTPLLYNDVDTLAITLLGRILVREELYDLKYIYLKLFGTILDGSR